MNAVASTRMRIGDVVALPGFVDWRVIFTDIKEALGLRHDSDVADLINAPRSTAQRWLDGSEPLYGYGSALMEVHTLVCGVIETQRRIAEFKEKATRAPS